MIKISQNWENLYIYNMKLTWDEFFNICQAQKPNNFKPPDWEKVKSVIVEKLAVLDDDLVKDKLSVLRTRYGRCIKALSSKTSADRKAECSAVVLDSEELNPVVLDEKPPLKKRKIKSLDQLGEKQLKYRTDAIWKKVEEFAEENEESTLRVMGMLLKKCKEKSARELGDEIWQQPSSSRETSSSRSKFISKDAAIAIMVNCSLGRDTYSKLKKILKQQGHDILPLGSTLKQNSQKSHLNPNLYLFHMKVLC